MKKISLLVFGIVCATAVMAQLFASAEKTVTSFIPDGASFLWSQTSFDFGKIEKSKPVTHKFTFTNNGNAPLIISSVKASCGCTVAEYTKEPIPAGAQGFVKATYNAAQPGVFSKTVTINSNTEEGVVVLTVKGVVE